MCCEWAKHSIQINGIGPGDIATAQTAPIRVGGHPFNGLVMTRTPAGRWGEPEDLVGTALLASRAGQYINGQVIQVDGGIPVNFGYVEGENAV
jgi:gluconate 5-dehydrogenase